jgi:hypothetical protein
MTKEEADEFSSDIIEAFEDKILTANDIDRIIKELNNFLSNLYD